MQICTLTQAHNHTSISPLSFLQARCPFCHPTTSIKVLKSLNVIKFIQIHLTRSVFLWQSFLTGVPPWTQLRDLHCSCRPSGRLCRGHFLPIFPLRRFLQHLSSMPLALWLVDLQLLDGNYSPGDPHMVYGPCQILESSPTMLCHWVLRHTCYMDGDDTHHIGFSEVWILTRAAENRSILFVINLRLKLSLVTVAAEAIFVNLPSKLQMAWNVLRVDQRTILRFLH